MTRTNNIERMGLAAYLDSTKDKHHGHGYDDLLYMLKQRGMSDTITFQSIANLYGVSRVTVHKWMKIFRAERATDSDWPDKL